MPSSDGPVAQVVWSEHGEKRQVQYLHLDELGSVRRVTDEAGATTHAYYDPFGQRLTNEGAAASGPVGDLRSG